MSLKATLTGSQIKHLKIALQCLGRIGLITSLAPFVRELFAQRSFHLRDPAGSELLLEGFPEKVQTFLCVLAQPLILQQTS